MEQTETFWNTLKQSGTIKRGYKMQDVKQEQNENGQTEIAEQEQTALAPDAIYKNNIYALVDDLKDDSQFIGLTDEELKNNKAFFPRLIQYIYNNYIGELLGNKHGKQMFYKDINQIDYIFNIYIDLVYKYKWNNRPLIIEFSLLTGISRETIYNWIRCIDNNTSGGDVSEYLTRERSDVAKKWIDTCERGLIDGNDTIKDIFILKAKYNYRENNDIQITVNHKNLISADELPALIDTQNANK